MEVESKIEDAKIRLAINPDFNCEDAFRLFDSNNKGYLTKDDIENTLNLLGIFPTIKRLKLLMKRYDLQKNGTINYADFFDMVVPFEKEYRQKIESLKHAVLVLLLIYSIILQFIIYKIYLILLLISKKKLMMIENY